jgi:hypothetical protein
MFWIYALILLLVLIPGWSNLTALPIFHLEDPIIVLGFLVALFSGRTSLKQLAFSRHLRRFTIPYALLIAYFLLLTILLAPLGGEQKFTYNIVSPFRSMKAFFFLALLFFLMNSRRRIHRVGSLLILLIFVEFVLMWCQKSNYLGVNYWLSPLYRGEMLKGSMLEGERVFGTFGNSNTMGTILSLLGTLAFARVIFGKDKLFRVVAAAAAVFSLVACVWLAKTRQGTFCLLVGCFLVQAIAIFKAGRRGWGSISMVLLVLGLAIAVIYLSRDAELSQRFGMFTGRVGIIDVDSLSHRLHRWPEMIRKEGGWLILGRGEDVTLPMWDSEYLRTLRLGGLPGLTFLLCAIFLPGIAAWRRLKQVGTQHDDSWLLVAGVAYCMPLFLANIVNTTWGSPMIMSTLGTACLLPLAAMKVEDREDEEYWITNTLLPEEAYEAVLPA